MAITSTFTKFNSKIKKLLPYNFVTKKQFLQRKILYINIVEIERGNMDFFQNMFSPISYRTNINDTLAAYNFGWYNTSLNSLPGPIYNFGGANNSGSIWGNYDCNYSYNPIFNFGSNSNSNSNNLFSYSGIGPVYNFANEGSSTTKNVTSTKKTNKTDTNKNSNTTNPNSKNKQGTAAFSKNIALKAESYIGYNEADGSYRKFSTSPEWCADFVTYVVRESYKEQGKVAPAWFGNWRCETLKQQAISHDKFLKTAGTSNKAETIKKQVKPGDILILRENGASHTGIVKWVDKETGRFKTIEGNVTNRKGIDCVMTNSYEPNNPEISGFIQLV